MTTDYMLCSVGIYQIIISVAQLQEYFPKSTGEIPSVQLISQETLSNSKCHRLLLKITTINMKCLMYIGYVRSHIG